MAKTERERKSPAPVVSRSQSTPNGSVSVVSPQAYPNSGHTYSGHTPSSGYGSSDHLMAHDVRCHGDNNNNNSNNNNIIDIGGCNEINRLGKCR